MVRTCIAGAIEPSADKKRDMKALYHVDLPCKLWRWPVTPGLAVNCEQSLVMGSNHARPHGRVHSQTGSP
jgi:hypothetical protein